MLKVNKETCGIQFAQGNGMPYIDSFNELWSLNINTV